MKILKDTLEFRVNSEAEAKQYLDTYRADAGEKGYTVKSAGYTYRTKKAKGEIVDEAWICKIVMQFGEIWEP